MGICSVKTSEGLNLDKEGLIRRLTCTCGSLSLLSLRQKTHTTAEFKHNAFINNAKFF